MKLSDLAQKFSDYDEKEKAILKRKNKKPLNEQKVIKGQGWILDRNLTPAELFIKKRNEAAFWAACQHQGCV